MCVYGIDLGNSYSCLAKALDNSSAEVIRNQGDQKNTLASAVYYDTDGAYYVGDDAKDAALDDPERLCQYFRQYADPNMLRIARKENPELYVIDGIERNPIELSAIVLKRIKAYAADQGEDVMDAVITCPAYYNLQEHEATHMAAECDGIHVLALVDDSTAAVVDFAARYSLKPGLKNVLVLHLGGCELRAALVHLAFDDGVTVLPYASVGMELGGMDWDQALENLVKSKLAAEVGCAEEDISQDVTLAIRSQVEKNKKALTEKSSVTFKFADDNGNRQRIAVTREEFDEATSALLDRVMRFTKRFLQGRDYSVSVDGCRSDCYPEQSVSQADIDLVILEGGSMLMPQVKPALCRLFGKDKIFLDEPQEAAARGAAIVAKSIKDGSAEFIDGQSTSKSFRGLIFWKRSLPPDPPEKIRIELRDTSPYTFGLALLDDCAANEGSRYAVWNFLMTGDPLPAQKRVLDICTHSSDQDTLRAALVVSRSPCMQFYVEKTEDGFCSLDAGIYLECYDLLEKLWLPHAAHSRIVLDFTMDLLGQATLKIAVPETRETISRTMDFSKFLAIT